MRYPEYDPTWLLWECAASSYYSIFKEVVEDVRTDLNRLGAPHEDWGIGRRVDLSPIAKFVIVHPYHCEGLLAILSQEKHVHRWDPNWNNGELLKCAFDYTPMTDVRLLLLNPFIDPSLNSNYALRKICRDTPRAIINKDTLQIRTLCMHRSVNPFDKRVDGTPWHSAFDVAPRHVKRWLRLTLHYKTQVATTLSLLSLFGNEERYEVIPKDVIITIIELLFRVLEADDVKEVTHGSAVGEAWEYRATRERFL
jgi:hypothetical protein